MADIFVSYKKEDRAAAERVITRLRADGRSVWWDDGLTPHQAWDATIEHEIGAAKAVLVLWTPRSVASDWVRSEAHYAQEHGKLVPVMLEPCTLPIAFILRQAIDLSRTQVRPGSAGWRKLSGWLDDLIEGNAADATKGKTVAATSPRAATRAKRYVGLTVLALVVAAGLFFGRHLLFGQARPDVVVNSFAVAGKGLPADFSTDLNDEMFATFSASSRITPRAGDGKRMASAYQLTGRIDQDGETIRVFAQVFAPDIDAPVLTTKLERPASAAKDAPLTLGLDLANTVRCIATGSDSSGSRITTLPTDALKSWAQFCNETLIAGADSGAIIRTLRTVVAAAPDFANGWSNLAESLAVSANDAKATNRPAILREAGQAADRALAIDPTTAKAYVVKAWLRLPYFRPDGPTLFPVLKDFPGWQQLADQSLSARPSDCGCEVIQYGFIMSQFGRPSAGISYFERGAAGGLGDWEADNSRAYALALTGRGDEAKAILTRLAAKWPNVAGIKEVALLAALWRRDWATAAPLVAAMPDGAGKAAFEQLVAASASNDGAGIAAAGIKLKALGSNDDTVSELVVTGLGIAGLSDDALAAAERHLNAAGTPAMTVLYAPSFAAARHLPGFGDLVERTGITRYWRQPGNRPDFCKVDDPPRVCAGLAKN